MRNVKTGIYFVYPLILILRIVVNFPSSGRRGYKRGCHGSYARDGLRPGGFRSVADALRSGGRKATCSCHHCHSQVRLNIPAVLVQVQYNSE